MLCHLGQDPVIALLCRTAINGAQVIIPTDPRRAGVQILRAGPQLLLVFPHEDLRRDCIIILIGSRYRRTFSRLPSIDAGEHDPILRSIGQVLEVCTILSALGGIAVIRCAIGNARLNAVYLARLRPI